MAIGWVRELSSWLSAVLCYTVFFLFGQDYFTHFEPSQSVGGAKTEDPKKNHLTTRKQNLACLTVFYVLDAIPGD